MEVVENVFMHLCVSFITKSRLNFPAYTVRFIWLRISMTILALNSVIHLQSIPLPVGFESHKPPAKAASSMS